VRVTTAPPGMRGSVEEQVDVQASKALQVTDLSVSSTKPHNTRMIRVDDSRLRVATVVNQDDTVQINIILVNQAGGPAVAQAEIQSTKCSCPLI
jgi:hypothetical protein